MNLKKSVFTFSHMMDDNSKYKVLKTGIHCIKLKKLKDTF